MTGAQLSLQFFLRMASAYLGSNLLLANFGYALIWSILVSITAILIETLNHD